METMTAAAVGVADYCRPLNVCWIAKAVQTSTHMPPHAIQSTPSTTPAPPCVFVAGSSEHRHAEQQGNAQREQRSKSCQSSGFATTSTTAKA